MKQKTAAAYSILLLSILWLHCAREQHQGTGLQGTISISGAWALYPMVVAWAEEFRKINPQVKLDISAGGAGKGMADCLAGATDLGMVSREIYDEERKKGAWPLTVTRDAVVPVVNAGNPYIADILQRGVTRDECSAIWITGGISSWAGLLDNTAAGGINVYTRSDACGAAQTWAEYLGGSQEDLGGIGVYGDPGLAEAVRTDVLGIGFNNINYAYNMGDGLPVDGIAVLPLDLNGNGMIDTDENFYASRDALIAGILSGRYPSPPARDLYLVSKGYPRNAAAAAFLSWILTDGQQYIPDSGYIALSPLVLQNQLDKLNNEHEGAPL